jgi:hypothetical protein
MSYPLLTSTEGLLSWARQLTRQLDRDLAVIPAGTITEPVVVANAVTVDLASGSVVWITLDQDLSTWNVIEPRSTVARGFRFLLGLQQDGVGSHLVAWPGAFVWGAGGAPTMSAAADAIDLFEVDLVAGVFYARVLDQGF